jgi:hypothetical protein
MIRFGNDMSYISLHNRKRIMKVCLNRKRITYDKNETFGIEYLKRIANWLESELERLFA